MRRILYSFGLLLLTGLIFTFNGCSSKHNEPDEINRAEIMLIHNKARSMNKVEQLEYDPILEERAQKWAQSMASRENLTHSRLNMSGTTYRTMGENIAMGYPDVDSVLQGWMDSSGHRRNILNSKFTHAGFGYAKSPDGVPYWCAQFGGE